MNTLNELREQARASGVEIKIGNATSKKLYPNTFHFKVDNPLEDWQVKLITEAVDTAKVLKLPFFYLYTKGLQLVK